MTTLGQAYVQIMPSAKGISGSIQKTLNPEATAAGKSAGMNIATSMASSMSKAGSTLTKAITVPVLGAVTALGGLVGALGFNRLVGMDNAQAKLRGLGIEGKQLEVVMDNARNAVQGTTFATAEGADVAAGALASGIKEGAELERYIKLVGDAAIGSNRPIADMAQIFNRVQGGGRLMRNELDMIEHGMPGFEQAIAKSLGVPVEKMREMATAGEITTETFLNTMEDFAGGMSAEYAKTWSGLKDNVISNIGIIGEALLEGLFEDGKEGLANFLDFLRSSDGLKEWARETGESIRDAIGSFVEVVKNAITWWTNLDGSTQRMLITFAGIAVAIGPVLLILSKVITTAITLNKGFAMLKVGAGIVSTALGAISTPVLVVIGVIAGLIALFTVLYQKNEGFRDLVQNVWGVIKETISTVIQTVSDFVMGVFGGLVTWWNENNQLIMETIRVVWETVQQVIMGVINALVPYIQQAWSIIKIATTTVWNVIKTVIQTVINTVLGIIKTVMQIITGDWSGAWQTIKNTVSSVLSGVVSIISSLLSGAFNIIKNILGSIKSSFSTIFNGLRGIVSGAFSKVTGAVRDGLTRAFNTVKGFFTKFKNAGRNIVTSIADGIKGAIGKVTGAISNVVGKVRDFLPFSPPKIGPLTDIMDVEWGETIGAGIEKGESAVTKAMDKILDIDLTKKANFNDIRQNSETNPHVSEQKQPIILQVDGKTFAQIMGDYTSQEGGERIRRIERGLA